MFAKNRLPPIQNCPAPGGKKSPTSSTGGDCSCCEQLECSVKYGKNRTLVPLGLVIKHGGKANLGPNPSQLWNPKISPTSKTYFANPGINDDPELELIDFTIAVNCKLDDAKIEIQGPEGVLFEDDLKNPVKRPFHERDGVPKYLEPGRHRWQWDGYNKQGVLDTKALKFGKLQVILTTTCEGQPKAWPPFIITCKAKEADWVDLIVSRSSKHVDMEWRLDLRPEDNAKQYVGVALNGIDKHWTRNRQEPSYCFDQILNGGNVQYTVATTALNGPEPKMRDDFDIGYIEMTDWDDYVRSHSVTFFPVVAERKIVYNDSTSFPQATAQNAKDDIFRFAHTAAHEVGHRVLKASYGRSHSHNHVGTSGKYVSMEIDQGIADDAPTLPLKTDSAEVALMWYYKQGTTTQKLYYDDGIASQEDVRGAIWLGTLIFKR